MKLFKHSVWYVFMVLAFADIITTLMVYLKHPVLNEANPLMNYIPIWGLFLIKLIAFVIICYIFTNRYMKVNHEWIRYFYSFVATVLILLNIYAAVNNVIVYQVDAKDVVVMDREVLDERYTEVVYDLEPAKQAEIPLIFLLLGFSMMQYVIWRWLENVRNGNFKRCI